MTTFQADADEDTGKAAVRLLARISLEEVRAQFPILNQRSQRKRLAFLDSAASAQKPASVLEAMDRAARTFYANVHRGTYRFCEQSTEAYEAARGRVQQFLGATDAKSIIFTKSATEAINLVAHSFGATLRPGDEIILTVMEHHANIVPWHMLRDRQGVVLRFARVREDGSLDIEHMQSLVSERTSLVSVTAMSNVLGTVPDLVAITQMAHAAGAAVLFDASQRAVHGCLDVATLDCDFLVMTGHKLYGPTGIGVLYGKPEYLDAMPPFLGGGDMIDRVTLEGSTWAALPSKFEAGTPPILEAIGLGAAIEFLTRIAHNDLIQHEQKLCEQAQEMLDDLGWVTVYGRAEGKGPVVSFEVGGCHPHDVATLLDLEGVAVRAGHHCAQPLMAALGKTGLVRASFAVYSCEEDIHALKAGLIAARNVLVK